MQGYGGKQAVLRDTIIEHKEDCLGLNLGCTLNVGDEQIFEFKSSDEGPLYLNAQEWETKSQDVLLDGMKKRKLPKKELEKQLADNGIETRGASKKLQQLYKAQSLLIVAEEKEIIEDGWVNQRGCYKFYGREALSMKVICSNIR